MLPEPHESRWERMRFRLPISHCHNRTDTTVNIYVRMVLLFANGMRGCFSTEDSLQPCRCIFENCRIFFVVFRRCGESTAMENLIGQVILGNTNFVYLCFDALLGLVGNHPFSTRFFCSKTSRILHREEKPTTPNNVAPRVLRVNMERTRQTIPNSRKPHHDRVPK